MVKQHDKRSDYMAAIPLNLELGGLIEKREFQINTWSRAVMAECTLPNPQKVHQLEKTGIWGEAGRQGKAMVVSVCLRFFRERGYRFP
ncbi:MAG: hypothetical protein PHI99_00165 [Syntrophales bacterium]|nr:hypothetical protein [Syntrophales bacterium]